MVRWVNSRLDHIACDEFMAYCNECYEPEYLKEFTAWIENDGPEKMAVIKSGKLGPLEKKYPSLIGWLCVPKKPKGKHLRDHTLGAADLAAIDVMRIRDIWRTNYNRVQRAPSDGPSALEIAAKRHGVKIELVESKLKSRTKTAL